MQNQDNCWSLAKQMPLYLYEDFDFTFPNAPWQIGLKSNYPEELKRRIAVALISFKLGLKSLDYTYKKYLNTINYTEIGYERLDNRIDEEIKLHMDRFAALSWKVSCLEDKKEGALIGEWSLLRIPFSMNVLVSCAHRGAFFEAVAIARAMLEQIAWSFQIANFHDYNEIMTTSASKSITPMSKKFPEAGKFYGWLSSHVHWNYSGHIKSFAVDENRLAHLFASSEFKAKSIAVCLLLSIFVLRVYFYLKQDDIQNVLEDKSSHIYDKPFSSILRPKSVYDKIWEHFSRKDLYSPDDLRDLENPIGLTELFGELESIAGQDEDISYLRLLTQA